MPKPFLRQPPPLQPGNGTTSNSCGSPSGVGLLLTTLLNATFTLARLDERAAERGARAGGLGGGRGADR